MSATQAKLQPKAKFIDFQALKQKIKITDAMPLLGLTPSQFNDQMRSGCPACKSGGDRALVITASKNVFYCFASGEGGDVIALTSHIKGMAMKDAAAFLAERFQQEPAPIQPPPVATVPSNSSPKKNEAGQPKLLNPLTYLQPEHPLVQALGISPETCIHFGAGYAPKGIMRGRLAIPIHDAAGTLIAYCGYALAGESPTLSFPNGFSPHDVIFNANKVQEGPITLLRDPLQVMKVSEAGIDNAVSFLTAMVSGQQLEVLASLMDQRQCEYLEMH